jgi:Uma2 family endonuclease
MSQVLIELPSHLDQAEFNLRRWTEVLQNRDLADIPGRIETDRYGRLIMSPPPAPDHGHYQATIAALLKQMLPKGRTLTECPISTADGVKGADVAWTSKERWRERGKASCFVHAPEICVEVLSPENSEREIQEKMELYFESGASEVWVCGSLGEMNFFSAGRREILASVMCPGFPKNVERADYD